MDQHKLQDMLAALWTQHRSAIDERVDILNRACEALRNGELSPAAREEAQSAAHKLAGVLGTFGRSDGTNLARHMELILSDPATLAEQIPELCSTLVALRKAIL